MQKIFLQLHFPISLNRGRGPCLIEKINEKIGIAKMWYAKFWLNTVAAS